MAEHLSSGVNRQMQYRRKPSRWAQDEGINLTPLLDMIFNLLFFFILATTIGHGQQIAVNLPNSKGNQAAKPDKEILVVTVTADNRYFLDGQELPLEELVSQCKQAIDSGQAIGVSLRGDSDANWQTMFTLFEAFSKNQLTKFLLDGERRSS